MAKRNYAMRDVFKKRDAKKRWVLERFKKKKECKQIQFNFCAGIINRFYEQWHQDSYAYPNEKPLFQHPEIKPADEYAQFLAFKESKVHKAKKITDHHPSIKSGTSSQGSAERINERGNFGPLSIPCGFDKSIN